MPIKTLSKFYWKFIHYYMYMALINARFIKITQGTFPRKFIKVVQEFQLRCKISICNKHFVIKIQREEKYPIKEIRNLGSGGVHKHINPHNCTACQSLPGKQGQYFLIILEKQTLSKDKNSQCRTACISMPFVTDLQVNGMVT